MKNQHIFQSSGRIMIFIMLISLGLQTFAIEKDFINSGETDISEFDLAGYSNNNVALDSCVADFAFHIDTISGRPNIYNLIDLSTGSIDNWEWEFGDGSTSSLQNPTHVFPDTIEYQIRLTVSGNNCFDQVSKSIKINVPLSINFTFKLDSNNIIPNTFIFHSEVNGYYDHLFWNFNNTIINNKRDTSHSYPEQDKDYQVCLTAQYNLNDTSVLRAVLCKGLTTSEYFNIGGQVYFGDSLLNNPVSTGDTALAYLYRVDDGQMVPIDTNYYTNLGYYWFAEKLKAYYIIKTALLPNSKHYNDFAPTYVGNTTQWEEAEIINLAQDKYREDIHLIEKYTNKSGDANLTGSIYDLINTQDMDIPATVCLFNADKNLIYYQYANKKGIYNFEGISKGHYWISVDYTGIPSHPKLVFIDGKRTRNMKESSISSHLGIFPNPAHEYCMLSYPNEDENKTIKIQIYTTQGRLLQQENRTANSGMNYFHINLQKLEKGLLILKIIDGQHTIREKFLHF